MRTIVVARTGPFVGPLTTTAVAVAEIQKPSHGDDLSFLEAISTARDEFNVISIAQELKLLANLRPDILIAGIETAEMLFESVHFIEGELEFAENLNALHDLQEPAARFRRFVA
jgi:hypothetical protein